MQTLSKAWTDSCLIHLFNKGRRLLNAFSFPVISLFVQQFSWQTRLSWQEKARGERGNMHFVKILKVADLVGRRAVN